MKGTLILILISICAFAWRSEDILNALSLAGHAKQASNISASSLIASQGAQKQQAQQSQEQVMSIEELTKLSKTDPKAMQKFIQSRTVSERTEVDKLMNFLAHGKYE
ncbi:MAG TPA: hypothetical protein VF450_18335 [Noviherbaspirillum sp.]